jgi:glucose/arabinose dehydrogenase
MLYVGLGDDAFDCEAFDITSLHGGILRLKVDGLPPGSGGQVARSAITPPDNPFIANPNANAKLVYAWGLRNPWRFQVDPVSGVIISVDVGDDNFEEMNEVVAGGFYGWPYREADMIRVLSDCPEPGGPGHTPYIEPIAVIARDTNAHAIVSGGMYRPAIGGTHNWPSSYSPSRGDVFYTDYYTGDLQRITWNGSSWVPAAAVPGQPTPALWGTGFLSAADFQVGPDGSLWWLQQFNDSFLPSTGSMNRVRYTGSTAVTSDLVSDRSLLALPNPFGRTVDLTFRLGAPERVVLAVYDLGGRRIEELYDGVAPAGESRIHWDGHDATGAVASAGVYFARLERFGSGATVTVPLFRTR